MKESDLFLPVKNFLKSSGCKEVYGEVSNFDVLGLFDVCNVGVELKKSLSFKLLDQAIDRLNYVEYLYIAIPKRKTPLSFSVRKILDLYKIGLLEIENETAQIKVPARFNRRSIRLNRKLNYNIRNQIKDYHKNEIGGVRSGEGETDYSIMIENIKRFLIFYKKVK